MQNKSDTPGELVRKLKKISSARHTISHDAYGAKKALGIMNEMSAALDEAIAALSRAPEAVAWRWRYSNKGPWQYTENPPSSGLYDGCEYEPLHTTPPAPQPALALIEELERALKRIVFDWDGEPEDMDEANEALASAKRFKEGE